ncbi:hypothetical protein [Marinovum sp. KMM 9879]
MTVTILHGQPVPYSVAGCADLTLARKAARARYAALAQAADDSIELQAQKIRAALGDHASPRVKAWTKLCRAIDASGAMVQQLAVDAVLASGAVLHALADDMRAPHLIGAARAVALTTGAEPFGIQIILADDVTEQQEAAVVFVPGRWAAIYPLVSGPGTIYARRRQALAQALSDAMALLINGAVDEGALRFRLSKVRQAVVELETGKAGLPTTIAEWRQFMLNEVDAEIFIFDLLLVEYKDTDCRIDSSARGTSD